MYSEIYDKLLNMNKDSLLAKQKELTEKFDQISTQRQDHLTSAENLQVEMNKLQGQYSLLGEQIAELEKPVDPKVEVVNEGGKKK